MPMFSVIIPVYNVEKYLKECIDSVLKQSFYDYEIVLVDDGSTDSSSEICDEYAKKHDYIKVIHQENGGLSDARNKGTLHAVGQYVLYLDSDDYWKEGCLSDISEILNSNSEVDVVLCRFSKYYNGNIVTKNNPYDRCKVFNKDKYEVLNYLFDTQRYEPSASLKVLKRAFLIENNLLFEKGLLSEDIEWNLRMMLKAHSFDVYNNPFYIYRQNRKGSIANTGGYKHIESIIYINEKYIEQSQIVQDKSLQNNLRDYCAFQLSITLYIYSRLCLKDKQAIRILLLKKMYMFEYAIRGKQKLVKYIYKILGIDITAALMKLYMKLR